jgi:hypothetical protein
MKISVITLFLLLLFHGAVAEECPPTPDNVKKAIENHIRKIRAYEYCKARAVKTEGNITIAVYTAEGACEGFSKKAKAGTCSNNWERHMIGSINGKIIGSISVGGKGDLSDNEIKISNDTAELIGLTIGPNDPMCCPSVPQTKKFNFSQGRFSEIKP